jgi:hypothetical protein
VIEGMRHRESAVIGAYPLVSIIIINFNDVRFILPCLESVFRTDYPNYEVIVVDCLTAGISKLVEKTFHDKVRLVHFDHDIGASESHNIGAKVAQGKYIAFLDNDVQVHPNWLREVVCVLEREKDVAATQGKILLASDRTKFDCAGGFVDRFGFAFQRGWQENDRGQYDDISQIFYAKGAAMTVRKQMFNNLGGFDKSFFLYYDETDFCWRLLLKRYNILYVPKSIVFHNVGMKEKLTPFRFYYYTRNHVTMLIKNDTLRNLAMIIPIIFLYYLGIIMLNVKNKKVSMSKATLSGLLWNLLRLKQIWKSRLQVRPPVRKESDDYVKLHMLRRPLLIESVIRILSG